MAASVGAKGSPGRTAGTNDMTARIIGILFLIAALAAAGFEVAAWIISGTYMPVTLGGLWYEAHRASLNAFQAGVQRYIAPWLWDYGIQWLLLWPAWAVLGVPGAILLWWGLWRRKRPRRRFFRRRKGKIHLG